MKVNLTVETEDLKPVPKTLMKNCPFLKWLCVLLLKIGIMTQIGRRHYFSKCSVLKYWWFEMKLWYYRSGNNWSRLNNFWQPLFARKGWFSGTEYICRKVVRLNFFKKPSTFFQNLQVCDFNSPSWFSLWSKCSTLKVIRTK